MTWHTSQAQGRYLRQCRPPSGQRAGALDRLTGIVYPDPNRDVGFAYDVAPTVCAAYERFSRGRLAEVQHAGGSTLYCHDLVGSVTRKVQITGTSRSALRYAYTNAGRLSALTYPDGSVADLEGAEQYA